MEDLTNIEFFKTPDGDVMYKRQGEGVRVLSEHDRDLVTELQSLIRTRYPEAFNALSDIYSRSERNRPWYEFRMVSRFIRCNLGDYDTQTIDIDAEGLMHFEQMKCPLMGSGDCQWECVICRPFKFNQRIHKDLCHEAEYDISAKPDSQYNDNYIFILRTTLIRKMNLELTLNI